MNRAAVVERARLGKPKRGPEHEVLLFPTIKTKTVTIPREEYLRLKAIEEEMLISGGPNIDRAVLLQMLSDAVWCQIHALAHGPLDSVIPN